MGFVNNLFGKKQPEKICKVEFAENGKVLSVSVPQGQWTQNAVGQSCYFSQKGGSLLQAAEILKALDDIQKLTYYVVDTPDGALGRDINGYYTEGPIKTNNLVFEGRVAQVETVEALGLDSFEDTEANQAVIAHLKKNGKYARLVLFMKCGRCGYASPVETQAGELARQCYCCGATNKCHRGRLNVSIDSSVIEI